MLKPNNVSEFICGVSLSNPEYFCLVLSTNVYTYTQMDEREVCLTHTF